MSESSLEKPLKYSVTLIYEGGPLDGDRTSPVLTLNPETLVIMEFAPPGRDGVQWGYTIADRRVDRTAGTAVLTLRWSVL
jgi:hypothetical protein